MKRIGTLSLQDGITCIVAGLERGSQNGLHLQGYLELSDKKRLSQVKTLLGSNSVHLEVSQGTAAQNFRYCLKDGQAYVIYGEHGSEGGRPAKRTRSQGPSGQGKTATEERLDLLKEAIENGASEKDLWDKDFYMMVRYGRALNDYRLLSQHKRPVPKVSALIGPTGVGKSRFVHHVASTFDLSIWVHPGGNWFDGYDGQDIALFEEYRGDIDIGKFLQLLDRYPVNVPVKGGFRFWRPRYIYVTSNVDIDKWYPNIDLATLGALKRRFNNGKSIEMVFSDIYKD